MNKSELANNVANSMELTKSCASQAIDCMLQEIASALSKGESVAIVGFGTFSVSERAARTGRNPQDGSTIQIPASKQVRFKAGKSLKDAVN